MTLAKWLADLPAFNVHEAGCSIQSESGDDFRLMFASVDRLGSKARGCRLVLCCRLGARKTR